MTCGDKVSVFWTGSRFHAVEVLVSYNKEVTSCSKYLDDKMAKSPPSISRILQKSTPLTKGTAVSSSNVKCTWNLNFFFFIIKDIVPSCWSVLIVWWRPINENREKVNKYTVFGCKAGAENPLLQCESFLKNCLDLELKKKNTCWTRWSYCLKQNTLGFICNCVKVSGGMTAVETMWGVSTLQI